MTETAELHYLLDPPARETGPDIESFLRRHGQPLHIEVPGRDRSRCRVLVTLLHGNETSGLRALHRLLREGPQPATTMHCFIPAVEAALLDQVFSHRQVPGRPDLNRCFGAATAGLAGTQEYGMAQEVKRRIVALRPEAVIDIHNTSGEGPSFAVTSGRARRHDALVALFTQRLVVTDLQLGALMELDREGMPAVTIECGGAFEDTAHRVAEEGLARFWSADSLPGRSPAAGPLDTYINPMRLEAAPSLRLSWSDQARSDADLTLRNDLEHFNFRAVTPQTALGWMHPDALGNLTAWDSAGRNHIASLYRVHEGRLYPAQPQKLFMITSTPAIARSDCLWYTVTAPGDGS